MKRSFIAIGALCFATLAASGATARAGVTGDSYGTRSVVPPHIMKPFGQYPQQRAHTPSGVLQYFNGPVEVTPKVYLIFWDYLKGGDPKKAGPYLVSFMKGLGGSSYTNIMTQYYEISGSKKYIQNSNPLLAGVFHYQTKTIPAQPTDAQVQAAANQGVAHFGYDANATYFVMTPTGHSTNGFGTQFCAYHGAFQNGGGQVVAYANQPYMPDAGGSCGANFVNGGTRGGLDGVSIVAGHEMSEAQTDPQPGSGWYDPNNGEEIGDLCAWQGLADISLSTGKFAVQPEYSNASGSCVLSY